MPAALSSFTFSQEAVQESFVAKIHDIVGHKLLYSTVV